MSCLKVFKYFVTILLSLIFLYSLVKNVIKYNKKNEQVLQSVMSVNAVPYPSITMCPYYTKVYFSNITSGTKNLTEYYERVQSMSPIKKNILSISQLG